MEHITNYMNQQQPCIIPVILANLTKSHDTFALCTADLFFEDFGQAQ